MKRKLILLLLCIALLCPVLTASAQEQRILDDAALMTAQQVEDLEDRVRQITGAYGMDVVILTVNAIPGRSIEAFADDFYDGSGYGIGDDASGVLVVLAMDSREWAISTCGDAIYAITDYGTEYLFSRMAPYLAEDEYYIAFDAYLTALEELFEAYSQGSPIDGYAGSYDGPGSYIPGTREDVVYYESDPPYWLSPIIGAVIAAVAVGIMASTMNTKRPQRSAGDYLQRGSARLNRQRDIYLYSQVSKVRRQTQSSGGSSVHRSSSGRSHGGGHGKF